MSEDINRLQLDAVFAAFPNLVFLLGPDDEFLDYRVGRDETLLVPPERFLGRRLGEVLPDPTGRLLTEALHRSRASGATEVVEYALDLAGGREHFEARMVPLPGGRVAALIAPITERKHAEERLHLSEERFRAIVATEPECVKVVSLDGRLLEVNRAGLEMLEAATLEDAAARALTEYVLPAHQPAFHELHQRVVAGETVSLQLEIEGLRGTRRWVETHATPVRGSDGTVTALLAITRDVTARRQAEREAARSYQDLQTLIDSLPVYVGFIDADLRVRFLNQAYAEWFGRPVSALVGQRIADVASAESWAAARPHVERALAGETIRWQRDTADASGRHRSFEAVYVPRRGSDGCVLGFFSVVTDVTHRRAQEDALRLSEERFRALIEKASDLVSIVAADGRIAFVSPAVENVLGFRPEEVVGRHVLDFLPADARARSAEALAALLATPGATHRATVQVPCRDGSLRTLDTVTRNLTQVPAVAGLVSNVRDVTEAQQLEEQLRQAQRLDSIGRLAGGIAHDFNNLLTAVLGFSELLAPRLAQDPEGKSHLAQIQHAGERARDLTRQLLSFARRQVLALVPLDLNQVVRDSATLLRRLLREDIVIDLALGDELGSVNGDAAQLEQVLVNLAVNARDAMPQGGTLRISTRRVTVSAPDAAPATGPAPGDYLALEVADTGAGIPPEVLQHVFEPFFTTKAVGEGNGLGLATVYGIVKQMGGHIQVESTPREGTTFCLLLPHAAKRSPTAATVAAAPPAASRGRETLLVVEDDDNVRALTRRLLEGAGYVVHAAANGAEALEIATRLDATVQLLVTDLVMPGLSGRDLARRLRERWPRLPVLFVSGYAGQTANPALEVGGVASMVAKPYRVASLLQSVRELIDRAAPEAPSA